MLSSTASRTAAGIAHAHEQHANQSKACPLHPSAPAAALSPANASRSFCAALTRATMPCRRSLSSSSLAAAEQGAGFSKGTDCCNELWQQQIKAGDVRLCAR